MSGIHSLQLIGSKSFGGAERWFQRFSLALAEMGHPTEIGVRRGHELDGDHWSDLIRHALPMRTVWDPLSRFEVRRLVRQLQPDIVQTYMGRATRLTHLPPAGNTVHVARLGGYYKLDGYRHAHAWIGNTKGICDYLLQAGLPKNRIFHLYNFAELPVPGLPPESLKRDLGIPEDAWVLMTPGRFVPFKGHRFLLGALAGLPAVVAGRPVWQVILGDGPLKQALHDQARASGIDERIVWAGWQLNPDAYYRLADMIVFPSTYAEPFGNVIIEAWGYAKPLVTSASMGASEVVRHEEDGLMFECENALALSQAIERALSDDALRQEMADAGRLRAVREFAREAIMQAYVELYRYLLEHR
ncbi:MAG: glycosyltransferase [Candidatus Thiodiazotropha endolucinida]|nr:glycosyltransferase [Candidatus Thiodiazotropha sp. (ex Lucina pensylvanica)]MCG7875499.1 glycosyltransferase [Candidatus Thiodiazotropha taylori]MCG8022673.1 glycosyltransferase [Candidatus Thiodiazotropha endolucinida]MCG7881570.1 glycosyltransferase [Candidatus Thiodiazotropha taylori]MCG7884637.1 glycosyltransferase [Candidatus Thiodiazotropha taylori]